MLACVLAIRLPRVRPKRNYYLVAIRAAFWCTRMAPFEGWDMTAEIINLRRARKAKAHQDKERNAATNRALHGQSKAQRLAQCNAQQRAQRHLDQALREGRPAPMSDVLEAREAPPVLPSASDTNHRTDDGTSA